MRHLDYWHLEHYHVCLSEDSELASVEWQMHAPGSQQFVPVTRRCTNGGEFTSPDSGYDSPITVPGSTTGVGTARSSPPTIVGHPLSSPGCLPQRRGDTVSSTTAVVHWEGKGDACPSTHRLLMILSYDKSTLSEWLILLTVNWLLSQMRHSARVDSMFRTPMMCCCTLFLNFSWFFLCDLSPCSCWEKINWRWTLFTLFLSRSLTLASAPW